MTPLLVTTVQRSSYKRDSAQHGVQRWVIAARQSAGQWSAMYSVSVASLRRVKHRKVKAAAWVFGRFDESSHNSQEFAATSCYEWACPRTLDDDVDFNALYREVLYTAGALDTRHRCGTRPHIDIALSRDVTSSYCIESREKAVVLNDRRSRVHAMVTAHRKQQPQKAAQGSSSDKVKQK